MKVMSLTEADRLESAILMLLRTSGNAQSSYNSSGDGFSTSCWPSTSEVETKTRRHMPLSTTSSLPLSSTHSSSSSPSFPKYRRSSVDLITAAAAPRPSDDRVVVSTRYKTELCRAFAEHGWCRYGDKCQFAHGRDDLRAVARHPKYKTDLCRTYHTTGLCPYGARCHFIHNEEEVRRLPAPGAPVDHLRPSTEADIAARELELRLALLLSLYQGRKLSNHTLPYVPVDRRPQQSAAVALGQLHLDRPSSTVAFQSAATRPSSLIGVLPLAAPGAVDSVGNSPSPPSSFVDDGELSPPPPLSPPVASAAGACLGPLATASNDRLTELLVLAARLRLLATQ